MTTDAFNLRAMLSRFMGYQGRRNLWRSFGYPNTISAEDYWQAYRRGGVANRVVKSFAQACWRDGAVVRDDAGSGFKPDEDGYSPFAQAWQTLAEDARALHYLERADRLSRVGQFGLVVMGFKDSLPLSAPQEGEAEIAYINAYAERSVTISKWDADPQSERYGLPEIYRIQVAGAGSTAPQQPITVHHSRVIHVAENADDSDVFGEPALRPVWNYLLDLEKISGSSAETFWLNARGGMAIEAASDASLSPDAINQMRDQAKEYEDQLRRVMALQGAKVQMLTTNVASPADNMAMLEALISGTTGIPQRILFGSERGDLASTQDENSWEARVDERRVHHCGPLILEPFVKRMMETGNLPAPQGDWWAEWPESSAASPEKQAQIAFTRAQALATYAHSASDQIVPPPEFRGWLGLEAVADEEWSGLLSEPGDADTLGNDDDV